jgi:15-cis-phytoene desaturase
VTRAEKPALVLTARIPQNLEDWALVFREIFGGIGVPDNEVLVFTDRILTLLTSCPERRLAEYENIPWWTFIDAANRSTAYQTLLGKGLTRSLVAVQAQQGSTRTVGYTFLQLLYGLLTYGGFDRLLNGPTNDVWLQPWTTYLRAKGVTFCNNTLVKSFVASEAGITSVVAERNGEDLTITADYYISAMPVEAVTPLVDNRMKALAPSLANLNKIETAWMNGIQFI